MDKLKLSKRLSMSIEEFKNLQEIMGGHKDSTDKKEGKTVDDGCWCTCHCMEANIMGFQLGMMGTHSTGKNESPKCTVGLTQMFLI